MFTLGLGSAMERILPPYLLHLLFLILFYSSLQCTSVQCFGHSLDSDITFLLAVIVGQMGSILTGMARGRTGAI